MARGCSFFQWTSLVVAVLILQLTGCMGSGGTAPPRSSSDAATHVAVIGDNAEDLSQQIQQAQAQHQAPVFEEVQVGKARYLFPVYSQVLRSKETVVVRAYGLIYIYRAREALLKVEGRVYAAETLPYVALDFADHAIEAGKLKTRARDVNAQGRQICADCLLVLTQFSPSTEPALWNGKIDPWQTSPDYVPFAGASSARKPMYTNTGGSCPSGATCYTACSIPGCSGSYGYVSDGASGHGYNYLASDPNYCTTSGNTNTDKLVQGDAHLQTLFKTLANLGEDPSINNTTLPAGEAANASESGAATIEWSQANVNTAVANGQDASQILFHEADHIFYYYKGSGMTSAPMGSGQTGTETVTIGGYSATYNLATASGLDGYQHVLIHNDLVSAYGTDKTGALFSALSEAGSLTQNGKAATPTDAQKWSAVKSSNTTSLSEPKQPNSTLSSQESAHGSSCPSKAGITTASYAVGGSYLMAPMGDRY